MNVQHEFQNGIPLEPLTSPNVAVCIKMGMAHWKTPSPDAQYAKQKTIESKSLLPKVETTKHQTESPTLQNINLEFEKGKLIGVIGPVGAGKSSLLQVLLRELPLQSGSLRINGITSYASQEPWVFAASVRQNILFGDEYDQDRYDKVVESCSLLRDFEQFENGDRTIVGEKGTLSGGQKARIKYVHSKSLKNQAPIRKCFFFLVWHEPAIEMLTFICWTIR